MRASQPRLRWRVGALRATPPLQRSNVPTTPPTTDEVTLQHQPLVGGCPSIDLYVPQRSDHDGAATAKRGDVLRFNYEQRLLVVVRLPYVEDPAAAREAQRAIRSDRVPPAARPPRLVMNVEARSVVRLRVPAIAQLHAAVARAADANTSRACPLLRFAPDRPAALTQQIVSDRYALTVRGGADGDGSNAGLTLTGDVWRDDFSGKDVWDIASLEHHDGRSQTTRAASALHGAASGPRFMGPVHVARGAQLVALRTFMDAALHDALGWNDE